jgi:O-antigen/teichoic acid export membrane protein
LLVYGSIALVGEWLSSTAYGSRYAGLGLAVACLCGAMALNMTQIPLDAALTVLGKGPALLLAGALRLVLTCGAGAALIGWLGVTGAALAVMMGYVGSLSLQWILVRAAFRGLTPTGVSHGS